MALDGTKNLFCFKSNLNLDLFGGHNLLIWFAIIVKNVSLFKVFFGRKIYEWTIVRF